MQGYENENNLSSGIEKYILELFSEVNEENFISLRRKDLAEMFGCVPSQINYVLRSRFSPERGYLIESRRGEYGYIKILKISYSNSKEKINHIDNMVGNEISIKDACRLLEFLNERDFISERERLLIEIALKNQNQNKYLQRHPSIKLTENANLLKTMLKALIQF